PGRKSHEPFDIMHEDATSCSHGTRDFIRNDNRQRPGHRFVARAAGYWSSPFFLRNCDSRSAIWTLFRSDMMKWVFPVIPISGSITTSAWPPWRLIASAISFDLMTLI